MPDPVLLSPSMSRLYYGHYEILQAALLQVPWETHRTSMGGCVCSPQQSQGRKQHPAESSCPRLSGTHLLGHHGVHRRGHGANRAVKPGNV